MLGIRTFLKNVKCDTVVSIGFSHLPSTLYRFPLSSLRPVIIYSPSNQPLSLPMVDDGP